MSDIIERADAVFAEVESSWRQGWGVDNELLARLAPELLDALKDAHAENERLRQKVDTLLAKADCEPDS
jgi:hypothetical protein